MATSSERTPPPFPETEDMDVDTEIEDLESNESEYTLEDGIGPETDANNVPDDIFSGSPTGNVSNPIMDSVIKSDTDAINELDEQPFDTAPKEEPNEAPDNNSFWTPLGTDVSKPEDGGKNPLMDPGESDMCTPDQSSAEDFLSESVAKPLAEWELETDSDPTNELTREAENDLIGEPVSDCEDIPVVDISHESVSVVSEPLFKEPLSEVTEPPVCDDDVSELLSEPVSVVSEPLFKEPLSDVTEPPVCDDDFSELLSEPVSDCEDIPVVDVISHESVSVVSEPLFKEPLSDVTEPPVCDDFSELLSEPVSVVSEPLFKEPLSDVTEPPVCDDDFSELLSEPASDCKDIPVVDVIHESVSVDSVIKSDTDAINELDEQPIDTAPKEEPNKAPDNNSFWTPLSTDVTEPPVCDDFSELLSEPVSVVSEPLFKEPLSDVTEPPVCDDDFSELLSEPASKQHKALFSDPPDDIFSEMLNCKDKQQSSVFSAASVDMLCLEAENAPITGPLSDDTKHPPSECVMRPTSPAANPDSSSDSRPRDEEEEQDIFAEATVELSLDSPAIARKRVEPSRLLTPASSTSASSNISKQQPKMLEELEEEDKFELNVSVTNPEKVGEGMNAYMAYRVSTQTTLPMFKRKAFEVRRRFSDFLGMYEKLSEKLSQNGYIVPPPPEKSFLGMTKMKVGKEDPSSVEFVEKRRAALERFLQKVLCHPTLLQDPDVREFLEREELPRAVNTQTFSGAGFLKIINRATEAVSKMTIKMNESDVWFEEKLQEVEGEDQQLRKLHAMVDSLVNHRKDLSAHTAMFAKSIGMLGSSEDNTALSRALCQLAEVEDKIEQLHQEQAGNDFFIFAELLADYIRLLGAVRGCFDQRMKMWQRWQEAQNMLQKKREVEAKLLWANKPEKLQLAKDEITEWEAKVTQYERDFERISATVRKEVIRFEKEKAKDFKKQTLKYLQVLVNSQQQLIKYWEAFLPEAKAIA
ncbi:sorting nexin-1a isoform X2 [Clupea harengus]|uniref:Sorting nexin-1 n=1 Tax=Clupea harengus TaxID=7950 RepID=A0A6P8F6J8_CLUHA|nr:sorting nexin-1a isoform X2 [Clupea harengus]